MLPWRQTNKRRTKSENRASQQIDQGLLTFAISKQSSLEMLIRRRRFPLCVPACVPDMPKLIGIQFIGSTEQSDDDNDEEKCDRVDLF